MGSALPPYGLFSIMWLNDIMNETALHKIYDNREEILTARNIQEMKKLADILYDPEANTKYLDPKDNPHIYKTLHQYTVCRSPIREKQELLKQYSSAIIYLISSCTSYYIITAPADREQYKKFNYILSAAGIEHSHSFRMPVDEVINVFHVEKEVVIKSWSEQLPILATELNAIKFTTYLPPKNPLAPFLFPREKSVTVEEFLSKREVFTNIRKLHYFALLLHLLVSTNLANEKKINTIAANVADIRRLLPVKFTTKELLSMSNNHAQIRKVNDTLFFTFDDYALRPLRPKDQQRRQYCLIPFKIINVAFRQQNLGVGEKGVKFFFLFLMGYRNFLNPFVNYKPSSIIRLSGLSPMLAKRGITRVAKTLTKCFLFLYKVGMISEPLDFTPEMIKENKAIKIRLYQRWDNEN